MHFGAALRLLRTNAGWTLRELAERVGVSNAYLSRVENGHDAPPTPDRLAAIATLFGVPPTTLIELADRLGPFTSDWLERVPGARELVREIVRRDLGPVEIARVRAFIEREFPRVTGTPAAGGQELAAILDPERVVLGLACSDLDDVIDVAAAKLARAVGLPAREVGERIRERERACPSAVGAGLAIPHATFERARPAAAIVTVRRALPVDTADGMPLRVLLVHVHRGGAEHARILATMARLADERVVGAVGRERTASGVIEILTRAA